MFLPRPDLIRLTGRMRYAAQRRVLDARGIRYILGGKNGAEPLVRADDLDASGKPAHRRGHRWHMIGSVRTLRP